MNITLVNSIIKDKFNLLDFYLKRKLYFSLTNKLGQESRLDFFLSENLPHKAEIDL